MKTIGSKIIGFSLATLLATTVGSTTTHAQDINFSDLPQTNVHYDNIYNLVERGVINGYPNGTYQPARDLTRAEAAVVLANALGVAEDDYFHLEFTDVQVGAWYYDEMAVLTQHGVFSGYQNGEFRPHEKLTRGQMAVMLAHAYNLSLLEPRGVPFTDVKSGAWYDDAIQGLYHFGVTSGVTKTKFAPNDFVRRDTIASFIINSEKVTREMKYEEWLPLYIGLFNEEDYSMNVIFNKDKNTFTIEIPHTTRKVEMLTTSEFFYRILPISIYQKTYLEGSDLNLTETSYDNGTNYIVNAMGLTNSSDLNDLGGKTIHLSFEDFNGDTVVYSVSFKNR